MDISIKWNICRLCLQGEQKSSTTSVKGINQQMQHLFTADKNLALHIYKISGITIKPNDSLPDKICNKCVSSINEAIQFRKTCRASNIHLHTILDRTKSASTLLKPDIKTYQVILDEFDVGNVESRSSSLFDKEFRIRNKNTAEVVNEEHQDSRNADSTGNIEEQAKVVNKEVTDIISNYKIELEDIIEVSDELEDQIFPHPSEDDRSEINIQTRYVTEYNIENSNIKSFQVSELQKCYMNAHFSKLKNISQEYEHDNALAERSETEKNVVNENSFLNNIENHNCTEFEVSIADEDFEYDVIDENMVKEAEFTESLRLDLEKNVNDNENQSPASSTVDTTDENAYYENNSNPISDLDEGCLIDDNLSSCNISRSNTSFKDFSEKAVRINKFAKKSVNIIAYKRRKPTFSQRKGKQNIFKYAADTGNELHICHICGNRFTNKSLMNSHLKVHLQTKNHQCELCFKRFLTACNLQAHMRIHTGERPYECQFCGKRFNDRSSNLRHERTHTNEKPFECGDCGKSFTLATTLQNHMKVHTNERLYRCEPCGKSFKLSHHLKTHQNTTLHRSVIKLRSNKS